WEPSHLRCFALQKLKKQREVRRRRQQAREAEGRQKLRRKLHALGGRRRVSSDEEESEKEAETEDTDTADRDQSGADEEDVGTEARPRYFLDFANCTVHTLGLPDHDRAAPSSHAWRASATSSPFSDPIAVLQKTVSRGDLWAVTANDDWTHPSQVLLCRSCWKGLHPRSGTLEVELLRLSSSASSLSASCSSTTSTEMEPLAEACPVWLPRLLRETREERTRETPGKLRLSAMLLGNFSNEFAAVEGIERLWKATKVPLPVLAGGGRASEREALSSASLPSEAAGDARLVCLSHALLSSFCQRTARVAEEGKADAAPEPSVVFHSDGEEGGDLHPRLQSIPLNMSSREAEQILREAISPNESRMHKLNDEQQAVLLAISRWFAYTDGRRPFQSLLRKKNAKEGGSRRAGSPRSPHERRREERRRHRDEKKKRRENALESSAECPPRIAAGERNEDDDGEGEGGGGEGEEREEEEWQRRDELEEEGVESPGGQAGEALGLERKRGGSGRRNDSSQALEDGRSEHILPGREIQNQSQSTQLESRFHSRANSDFSRFHLEERRPRESEATKRREITSDTGATYLKDGRRNCFHPASSSASSLCLSCDFGCSSSSREASPGTKGRRVHGGEAGEGRLRRQAPAGGSEARASSLSLSRQRRSKKRKICAPGPHGDASENGEDFIAGRNGEKVRNGRQEDEMQTGETTEKEDFEDALRLLNCSRRRTDAPPFLLVQGVFGAGKSSLLAAALATLSRLLTAAKNKSHILLVCVTNAALDSVLLKLRFECMYTDFVRIGRLSETHPLLLPHAVSSSKDRAFALQEWKRLLHQFLVTDSTRASKSPGPLAPSRRPSSSPSSASSVPACLDIHKRVGDQEQPEELSVSAMAATLLARIEEGTFPPTVPQWRRARLFAATCSTAACSDVFLSSPGLAIPFVFLDEATQAPETQVVSILSRFASQRLLQVGDCNQLPPVVKFPRVPFCSSFFSRVLPTLLEQERRAAAKVAETRACQRAKGTGPFPSVSQPNGEAGRDEGEGDGGGHGTASLLGLEETSEKQATADLKKRARRKKPKPVSRDSGESGREASSGSPPRSVSSRSRGASRFCSAVLFLRSQYRCHPVIGRLCSRLFYGADYVKNGVSELARLPPLPSSFRGPLCCVSIRDSLERREGKSFVNWKEAFVVASIIQNLLKSSSIFELKQRMDPSTDVLSPQSVSLSGSLASPLAASILTSSLSSSLSSSCSSSLASSLASSFTARRLYASDVGVICLYRSQVACVESALKKVLPAAVVKEIQISTVDAFQGGEKEVVLLSCVRTTAAFLERRAEREQNSFRRAGPGQVPARPPAPDEAGGAPSHVYVHQELHARPGTPLSCAETGEGKFHIQGKGEASSGPEAGPRIARQNLWSVSRSATAKQQASCSSGGQEGALKQKGSAESELVGTLRLLQDDPGEADGGGGSADKGKDFVNCRKRMNVAFSRARRQLVIVSHQALFQSDPAWREVWNSSVKLFL
ncbi:AAA domain protein, partial [Toxoplasma gondii p89]